MKLRLTHDAQQALVAAVADARKRKHAEVTAEHVLAALIDIEDVWSTLVPSRFYRREVAALAHARLARLPEMGGYRDASAVVPLSLPVRKILEEQRRGLVFTRVISATDLLDALMEEPAIAGLVAEAGLDIELFEGTLESALNLARQREHISLRTEHVFRVVVEERWFARAVHDVGGDIDVLRQRLDTALDSFASLRKTDAIRPTKALGLLVARLIAYGRRHPNRATSDLFVIYAMQDRDARTIFTEAGIKPFELLASLVHGVGGSEQLPTPGDEEEVVEYDVSGSRCSPDSPLAFGGSRDVDVVSSWPARTSSGYAEVIFHNDDFTTQEVVVRLLTDIFEIDRENAVKLMLCVHMMGEAVIASLPLSEAREKARATRAMARDAGYPLRITIRRLPPKAEGER